VLSEASDPQAEALLTKLLGRTEQRYVKFHRLQDQP
jgi:hypothetical protein